MHTYNPIAEGLQHEVGVTFVFRKALLCLFTCIFYSNTGPCVFVVVNVFAFPLMPQILLANCVAQTEALMRGKVLLLPYS